MSWSKSETERGKELKGRLSEIEKPLSHIAIIMDGNGRWANSHKLKRIFGHRQGIETVRDIVKASSQLGIKHLTLYAFSTENWARPESEVSGLMKLLESYLKSEINELDKNNVILTSMGDIERLPNSVNNLLKESYNQTKHNTGLTLNLALSYSGKWDIVRAVKHIAADVLEQKITAEQIDDALFSSYLSTSGMGDVDLLIRTSGELRVSNFLLWEIAYSEFYVTDKLWPEFKRDDLYDAIECYLKRDRRFGELSK
ncbi:MAG: isoprenyl transferase [bacterium]